MNGDPIGRESRRPRDTDISNTHWVVCLLQSLDFFVSNCARVSLGKRRYARNVTKVLAELLEH